MCALVLADDMRAFVINIARRVDRWAVVEGHLADRGIHATRFSAIETKPGWKGCRDSHLTLLDRCKKEVVFMILEDDVEFLWEDPLEWVEAALEELPLEWDALFLGASPQEPQERYSEHLYGLKNAFTTHAIIWHVREDGAVEYILSHRKDIGKIDVYFRDVIFPNFNCFLTWPLLATQRQTQSDCCSRSDLSTIVKNYNRFCK